MVAGAILHELEAVVGKQHVTVQKRDLHAYAYDATGQKVLPGAVVWPASTDEVSGVLGVCHRRRVPVVPRGAATNISGGTVPRSGCVVLCLDRLNQIVRIDPVSRIAVVQAMVRNLAISEAARPHGLFYAPDPASQRVSTIGGNVMENSGGLHCLKYGITTHHVLALEFVLPDGTVLEFGSAAEDSPGYDLRGLVIGSEGTTGVVTQVTVRLLPLPAAVRTLLAIYDSYEDAVETVSAIIAARIIPAALEMLDKATIDVIMAAQDFGYPRDCTAVLVIDLEGPAEDLEGQVAQVLEICRRNRVREVKTGVSAAERANLWAGRKTAYGAIARMSQFVWTQDVTVPRNRLPEMLRAVLAIGKKHGIPICTIAHAGDGNLHPCMPYNPADPDSRARKEAADDEIISCCLELGGSITGEHGVGLDKIGKMSRMFTATEMELMQRIRSVFDPRGIMNPGKKVPVRTAGF